MSSGISISMDAFSHRKWGLSWAIRFLLLVWLLRATWHCYAQRYFYAALVLFEDHFGQMIWGLSKRMNVDKGPFQWSNPRVKRSRLYVRTCAYYVGLYVWECLFSFIASSNPFYGTLPSNFNGAQNTWSSTYSTPLHYGGSRHCRTKYGR